MLKRSSYAVCNGCNCWMWETDDGLVCRNVECVKYDDDYGGPDLDSY